MNIVLDWGESLTRAVRRANATFISAYDPMQTLMRTKRLNRQELRADAQARLLKRAIDDCESRVELCADAPRSHDDCD